MSPARVRLRRTRGSRKPAGAIVVARPTPWGNPWHLGDPDPDRPDSRIATRARMVELYRRHLDAHPELVERARAELAGADLACWCPLDEPCHADVLLEVANARPGRTAAGPATTTPQP
jgi:Domain of unknown function (DUF4326)